jgi:muramoyltetrapeptide carboxypeptidase
MSERLVQARALVEALGLRPTVGEHASARYGYLAGSDDERAADFNAAVGDPNVRALFTLRGGYGAMRVLDRLDYDGLRADPKIVLGYSDITAILNAVTARAGLVTFHGPLADASQFTAQGINWLRRALMDPRPIGTLESPQAGTIVAGSACGRLVGGNLSLICALLGTPYALDFRGAVAFFEEIREAPYRIDRMLTQLMLSGAFEGAAGIAVGTCVDCDPSAEDAEFSLSLLEMLRDRLQALGKPAFYGAQIGHLPEQRTLPIGVRATLDANARTLTIEEAGVV